MSGAAHNGACKTSRFDCRFVIKDGHPHGHQGREADSSRTTNWETKRRLPELGTQRSRPFASDPYGHLGMIINSFLCSPDMRITHREYCAETLREAIPVVLVRAGRCSMARIRDAQDMCHVCDNTYIFQRIFTYMAAWTSLSLAASADCAERLSVSYPSHAFAV